MAHVKTRGRPDMIDEQGKRIFIHPTEVKGVFRTGRNFVQLILIFVLLVLPWIQIHGRQAFLIDIVHRQFVIFGHVFFAQDVPLLFLVLINFVLGIALITTLVGRVWCGWACPQTVFVEGIFRRIERMTEGKPEERRRRDQQPLTTDGFIRKIAKWSLFILCTLWITHSLLAIFIGKDHILEVIRSPIHEHPVAFGFIVLSNIIFLLDFGWFREQFCMIACPYGKFQSVLQDSKTVTVMYQTARGEPRRSSDSQKNGVQKEGDCVDCGRCVSVCPTGIDIRNGTQLECIACTACIDACDDVMTRLKRPNRLIGYYSETGETKIQWKRIRVLLYLILLVIFGSVMIWKFSTLKPFEVLFIKTKGEPYRVVSKANEPVLVVNVFSVEITNKSAETLRVHFSPGDDVRFKLIMPNNPIIVNRGQVTSTPMTIEFSKDVLKLGSADSKIKIDVTEVINAVEMNSSEHVNPALTEEADLHVIGPF